MSDNKMPDEIFLHTLWEQRNDSCGCVVAKLEPDTDWDYSGHKYIRADKIEALIDKQKKESSEVEKLKEPESSDMQHYGLACQNKREDFIKDLQKLLEDKPE